MEENKSKVEKLLEKIHISLYNFNPEYEELEDRSFLEVISDLAKSWQVLNDDYKDELYEAMGIMPSVQKSNLSYPVGVREPFGICGKDTGIEYLQNQPTCRSEV